MIMDQYHSLFIINTESYAYVTGKCTVFLSIFSLLCILKRRFFICKDRRQLKLYFVCGFSTGSYSLKFPGASNKFPKNLHNSPRKSTTICYNQNMIDLLRTSWAYTIFCPEEMHYASTGNPLCAFRGANYSPRS